jgi:NAD(P)H-hydrate epimerase
MAALRTGAGLVTIAAPEGVVGAIRSYSPDLIVQPLTGKQVSSDDIAKLGRMLRRTDAMVLGPGIGLTPKTHDAIPRIIGLAAQQRKPLLIDADATKALKDRLGVLKGLNAVLTPHAGEFKVMSETDVPSNWEKRIPVCTRFARKHSCVLLLKGHDTVITDGKKVRVNRTGNPALATAGTGDVLSGIIGTYLAQAADPFQAAVAGAYIHGRTGDLVREKKGFHIVASDLIEAIPTVLKGYDRISRP